MSLRFHQFFFLKDISTIAFALTMGVAEGWPLLLMSSVSAISSGGQKIIAQCAILALDKFSRCINSAVDER